VRKLGFVVLLAFMVILIGISQLIFPQSEVIPNDPQLSPYISIFLMGITLAALQTEIIKRPQFPDRYLKTIGILGYVGLASVIIMVPSVYSIIFKNVDNSYFHKQLLLQSLCWALVLLSAVNVRGFIQNICKLRMLRFFGTLSFSLYLFHPIVIGALQFFEIDTPVNGWIVLAVSTLAAFISFKLFEEPLSRVKILKS
jgi:peptidoglycan/LPS O-acetylase OafA/YrhL